MIDSNMNFEPMQVIDDSLTLAVAKNIQEGGYFSRENKEEIGHNNGKIIPHPVHQFLIRSGENHMLTKGSCKITYTLDSKNMESIIEEYKMYAEETTPDAEITVGINNVIASWDVNFSQDTWSEIKAKYSPLSDSAKIEVSEGSEFACFLRIDGEPEAWTVEYKDITANTPTTIEKEGNQCYVFFTNDITKQGQNIDGVIQEDVSLESYKYYKLTSGDIQVIANQDTKVVRLYRD